jgi:C1A family cysteine protease
MYRRTARYGWIPDLPDQRDQLYSAPSPVTAKLPKVVDLRPKCPPVYDQGHLGSCTANAIAAAYRFELRRQKAGRFLPSRLFIYYNERVIEGTIAIDSGAMLRDGIKSLARQGACSESTWPYDIERFADKPGARAYVEAKKHQALGYQRVAQEGFQMRGCLASGYPFVFGFVVYESFESERIARTGLMTMPGSAERPLGGHAVMAVGYDDHDQVFLCQNSWTTAWGERGFFRMPYAYLGNPQLARDLWTIRAVEG